MKWTYNQETGEELTPLEKILNKKSGCGNSGTKYSDGFGHEAAEPYFCRIITCGNCVPHRINNLANKFAWMNSPDFVFKTFLKIKNNTVDEIRKNRADYLDYCKEIHKMFPDLWFRFSLTANHFILMLKREDEWLLPFDLEFTFEQYIKEFVDWSHLDGKEEQEECLLIEFKGQRRIRGHGATPEQIPQACNRTPQRESGDTRKQYSLKQEGAEVIPKEELEHIPKAEFKPIEQLLYIVMDGGEQKTIDFKEFLKARLAGNYQDEWEEYHGVLESTRMQRYLAYLKKNDSKNWGFLE